MYGRGRGRGRGYGRARLPGVSSTAVNEEGKLLSDLVTGPPLAFPETKRMPPLPEIDSGNLSLLDRWHKLRHVYRSGPFFVETEEKQQMPKVDPFAVKRYTDESPADSRRPPLTAVLTLSSHYFPDELSSKKDKRASSKFAESSEALDVFWMNQMKTDKEMDKFDELAKKTEEERKEDSDNDANDLAQEEGEDEYSENDYEQGEYFDDDEGYDEYEDGGDDDGPVY